MAAEFHAAILLIVVAIVLRSSRIDRLRLLFRVAPPLLLVFLVPAGTDGLPRIAWQIAFLHSHRHPILSGVPCDFPICN